MSRTDKIELKVVGVSFSESYGGAYALILQEENGERRLPIIIGVFEAQAIAIKLENIIPPRPLTHDLFVNIASALNIDLLEVNIYKLEEGIFYSNLVLQHNSEKYIIDSRTSDAIALALRFNCPIYTTREIMDRAGIIFDFNKEESEDVTSSKGTKSREKEENIYNKYTLEELEEILKKLVETENYEEASKVRDEIERRKKR